MVLIPLLDVLQSVPVLSVAILTLPLQLRFLRPQAPATNAKRASVDLSQRLCGRLMGWSGRPARFQARRPTALAEPPSDVILSSLITGRGKDLGGQIELDDLAEIHECSKTRHACGLLHVMSHNNNCVF